MTTRFLLLPLALALLSACTGMEPAAPVVAASAPLPDPVDATPPLAGTGGTTGEAAGSCDAAAAQSTVGTVASAAVVERARIAAGARSARTLAPGQYTTMEFKAGRLNLSVDAGNVVVRVSCG